MCGRILLPPQPRSCTVLSQVDDFQCKEYTILFFKFVLKSTLLCNFLTLILIPVELILKRNIQLKCLNNKGKHTMSKSIDSKARNLILNIVGQSENDFKISIIKMFK